MPPFFSNGPANNRRAGPSCDEPPTNLKVMVGVKARNKNHSQGGGPGSAEARAAATVGRDDGERAPPGGSAVNHQLKFNNE